jgi:hypothetical protein
VQQAKTDTGQHFVRNPNKGIFNRIISGTIDIEIQKDCDTTSRDPINQPSSPSLLQLCLLQLELPVERPSSVFLHSATINQNKNSTVSVK